MAWFWLSFADPDRPKGTQFLGACLVQGTSFMDAIQQAHMTGLNPGGEVQGFEVPQERLSNVKPKWCNRLLTRSECEEMDREALN